MEERSFLGPGERNSKTGTRMYKYLWAKQLRQLSDSPSENSKFDWLVWMSGPVKLAKEQKDTVNAQKENMWSGRRWFLWNGSEGTNYTTTLVHAARRQREFAER